MNHWIAQLLARRLTNDGFDLKLAQVAYFGAGVLVLALSMWKLTRFDLTEAQLFFGVLLSFITPLLLVVIGLLLPIAKAARQQKA